MKNKFFTRPAAVLGTIGIAMLLSGCSYTAQDASTPNLTRSAYAIQFPRFSFGNFAKQGPKAQYAALVDEGFELPAIPVDKIDPKYLRQRVAYETREKPGTVVVDVPNRFLYLVEEGGTAMRYGVGVGRQGFEWSGTAYIGWKAKWPRWTPPETMIRRKPELVKYSAANGGMDPGPSNPLGARAMYLMRDGRDTMFRLHGTPEWASIGTAASSGCVRLMNQDIIDLYERVPARAKVVVLQ